MPFNQKAFLKTKWQPRIEDVPVPDLQAFFLEGEAAAWKVRGLTGQELGRADEAADRSKTMIAIIEGLAGTSSKEKTDAMKELLGVGGNAPKDIAKRLEHLVMGSVEPSCTMDLAVRLCEAFPVEFLRITNKIIELTGMGQMPGKQTPSGGTQASGQASPSATPGGDSSMKPGRTSSRTDT